MTMGVLGQACERRNSHTCNHGKRCLAHETADHRQYISQDIAELLEQSAETYQIDEQPAPTSIPSTELEPFAFPTSTGPLDRALHTSSYFSSLNSFSPIVLDPALNRVDADLSLFSGSDTNAGLNSSDKFMLELSEIPMFPEVGSDWDPQPVEVANTATGETGDCPELLTCSESDTSPQMLDVCFSETTDESSSYAFDQTMSDADLEAPDDLQEMGYRSSTDGGWTCKWESCKQKKIFYRACDLRKHFATHQKTHACTHADCSMVFATAKDLRRHSASHMPQIACAAVGCPRMFSRLDNMNDHYRRIHRHNRLRCTGIAFRRTG